jgi:phytoene synthase
VGALELLKELERRDFDLWSEPLDLSFFRRVQVYVQTVLGRSVSG